MRAELRTGEEVLLTRRNESGFWGGYTVAWYGPGEVDLSDVFFGTPQSIESKKKGTWLPGTFYATDQRIIFEGENIDKYKMIALEIVDSFTLKSNGLDVLEENGSVSTFQFPEPSTAQNQLKEILHGCIIQKAKHCEEVLDHNQAIKLWGKIGKHEEAKRVREMVIKGQSQTVVHGDYVDDRDTTYVDDRDTIVKDSVMSKSNIGAGSSKMQELKELKEMFDSGFISEEDMEKMKKEIME